MYYIYHIFDVKIGCSTQPTERVLKQGYTDFEILETHDCIDTASKRELELQKEYGYEVDDALYKHSYNNRPSWNDYSREQAKKVTCRKVLQYDLDGNFIKEWESTSLAAREVGGINNTSSIRGTIRGSKRQAYGYQWRFKISDNIPNKINKVRERYKRN